MHKRFLLVALLLAAFNASAAAPHAWKIKVKLLTLNPKIPSTISALDFGYQFELQYNLPSGLYVSASTTRYDHGRWGIGSTLGLAHKIGIVSPYAEINYNHVPTNNRRWLSLIGYDVGANIQIWQSIAPFIEVDNFFQHNKEAMQVGLGISLTPQWTLSGAYAWHFISGHSGANVKVSYSF